MPSISSPNGIIPPIGTCDYPGDDKPIAKLEELRDLVLWYQNVHECMVWILDESVLSEEIFVDVLDMEHAAKESVLNWRG